MKATPPALSMGMPLTTSNCAPVTRPATLTLSSTSEEETSATKEEQTTHVSTRKKKHTSMVIPKFSTGITAVQKVVTAQSAPPASLSLATPFSQQRTFIVQVYPPPKPPRVQGTCLSPILLSERNIPSTFTETSTTAAAATPSHHEKDERLWFHLPGDNDKSNVIMILVQHVATLVAVDMLRVFILQGTIQVWMKRIVFRVLREWQRRHETFFPIPSLAAHPQPLPKVPTDDYTVRGIPNYGQSCFLNSVLQALTCLDSFLVYLERIVYLQQQQSQQSQQTCCCLSQTLWYLLQSLQHSSIKPVDPRLILRKIAFGNKQFQAIRGGTVGGEQQDAQELLQALLGLVIEDGNLDNTTSDEKWSSLEASIVSSCCEENNGIMSLSAFLNRMHEEQTREESNSPPPQVLPLSDDVSKQQQQQNGPVTTKDYTVLEEKKQEDFEHDANDDDMESTSVNDEKTTFSAVVSLANTKLDNAMFHSHVTDNDDGSDHPPLSPSTRLFLQTISPSTPSPLSGWLGSTIQCCECHHVRPIQNAPFLDIPIVPSSVSQYMSGQRKQQQSANGESCSLAHLLEEFTSVERVSDVECRNCTLQQEMAQLKEEVFMLQGAIKTVMARKKAGTEQVEGLQSELARAESKLAILEHVDPDGGDDGLQDLTASMDEIDFGTEPRQKPLRRGMAKKCLLFTRLPNVLCLHVQRRYYDPSTDRMAKTWQHVDFPEVLDMSPYCAYGRGKEGMPSWAGSGSSTMATASAGATRRIPMKLYRLMSVIEHCGNAFSGHYQTYRRVRHDGNQDEQWVLISDENVSPMRWSDVRRCQAYMLFYEVIG